MSNPFFDLNTLMEGGHQMLQLIKQCAQQIYEDKTGTPVHPNVEPGFLRHQLPEDPPQQGREIEHLMEMTKKVIFPGCMKWQSPKYFGYYPSGINVTNVFGQMFHMINQTPMFNYYVAPAWTQIENITVDWSAKALGLPEHFLMKNSGGGIINNSASESIFNSVHVAKFVKRKELGIEIDDPKILKFVGYFGEGSHISSERALMIKDICHKRAVPYVYNPDILNFDLDVDRFQQMLKEDIEKGLIPFWFGFSYGNTFCSAVDCSQRAFEICKKHNIWINVDAAWLGSTWISQKYRPSIKLLEYIDSIDINFTKLLLNGTGGSLFYVKNKMQIAQSFGASAINFHFYKNKYTGQNDVFDYKDWIVGLARRNNGLKLYYFFDHYGVKKIKDAVQGQQDKFQHLISMISSRPDLFKLYTRQYGVITFFILDKNGSVSHELTRAVNTKIANIKEGFSTPGEFKGVPVIRIVVGHFHTQNEHVKRYFDVVISTAEQLRSKEDKKQ